MDSEAPLFILYTSGSTGKPREILHTTGAICSRPKMTTKYIFGLRDDDVYWCTADVGWGDRAQYVVSGRSRTVRRVSCMKRAKLSGTRPVLAIVEKYGVTILYTAPTAIRAL